MTDLDELLADAPVDEVAIPDTEPDAEPTPPTQRLKAASGTRKPDAPAITAMCVHNTHLYITRSGRLFRASLRFRDRNDWEEVGLPSDG